METLTRPNVGGERDSGGNAYHTRARKANPAVSHRHVRFVDASLWDSENRNRQSDTVRGCLHHIGQHRGHMDAGTEISGTVDAVDSCQHRFHHPVFLERSLPYRRTVHRLRDCCRARIFTLEKAYAV